MKGCACFVSGSGGFASRERPRVRLCLGVHEHRLRASESRCGEGMGHGGFASLRLRTTYNTGSEVAPSRSRLAAFQGKSSGIDAAGRARFLSSFEAFRFVTTHYSVNTLSACPRLVFYRAIVGSDQNVLMRPKRSAISTSRALPPVRSNWTGRVMLDTIRRFFSN